jgi:hypothetical protein
VGTCEHGSLCGVLFGNAGCGGDDASRGENSGEQETWRNGQTIRDKRVRIGKEHFTRVQSGLMLGLQGEEGNFSPLPMPSWANKWI